MTVSLRIVISLVPTSEAKSDMLMAGANEIGGFGVAGAVVQRFVVDILLVKFSDSERQILLIHSERRVVKCSKRVIVTLDIFSVVKHYGIA